MARRPRELSDADKALWKKVTDSTEKLYATRRDADQKIADALKQPKGAAAAKAAPFRLGEAAKTDTRVHDLAPSISDHIRSQHLQMDQRIFGKMKRGKLAPEGRIDLHGMTQAQAHPVLVRFILDAVAADRRLVLVITGKGKHRDDGGPIPVRHGVLRHQVPHWLNTPPLRQHVLQITESHVKHGGQGAYYVYLRRRRPL